MGYINGGIPKEIVANIIEKERPKAFIETGTYIGDTAIWASALFEKVYTIEIMPEMSQTATKRAAGIKNISFLLGDSSKVLPTIINELKGNSFFWLDGHYSGEGTGGEENECPVMDEITIISKCKDAIILIDDARCFYGPPPKPHNASHWPGIADIFNKLKLLYPNHYTTVVDDVIFCVPMRLKSILDTDWQEHFYTRFAGKKAPAYRRILGGIKNKLLGKS